MPVYVDIQGVQSRDSGLRGIGRYVAELARALEARDGGERIGGYVLNPELPVPAPLAGAIAVDRMIASDELSLRPGDVYHVTSPFEGTALTRVWPAAARADGVALAVTLYDLIPLIYAEQYLAHDAYRWRYENRLALIRHADRVLTISAATARDAVERLGVQREALSVSGTGVSAAFARPASREAAFAAVAARIPGIQPEYVLYTGALDFRKNVDALLDGYAQLPADLRQRHQLLIVSRLTRGELETLRRRLETLGVSETVRLATAVSDTDLVPVYQAAGLFVFPSLYEGFGLPAAEAIACGTPTIAGRTSSLVEIVTDDDAFFDPRSPDDLAATMQRALTDPDLHARLAAATLDPRHTWSAVADRVLGAYAALSERPVRRDRRTRRTLAAIVSAEESPWSVRAAGGERGILATIARALLWPARRFFDPRFGGVDGHLIAMHGDLAHRMEQAFGPAGELMTSAERTQQVLADLRREVEGLRAGSSASGEWDVVRLPFALAALHGLRPGSRVLDAGGGTSALPAVLCALGHEVTVLDPAGYPLEQAGLHVARSADELPPDDRFDAVVLAAGAAVPRLRDRLRPGGVLVAHAPLSGADGLRELLDGLDDVELRAAVRDTSGRWRVADAVGAAVGPDGLALASARAPSAVTVARRAGAR